MRFAPPKSAPPDSRKLSKDVNELSRCNDGIMSGWMSVPVQDDLSFLTECAAASLRRCSSATQRHYDQLVVHFRRYPGNKLTISQSDTTLSKGDSKYAHSKDSGVDTDTQSMDRMKLEEEEEEFSDLSDSDEQSVDSEADVELLRLAASDSEDTVDLVTNTVPCTREPEQTTTTISYEAREGFTEYLNRLSKQQLNSNTSLLNTTKPELTPHPIHSKRCTKNKNIIREHQMPSPITPDIPECPNQTKTSHLWSRCKKLERHSTSPALFSYNDISEHSKKTGIFLNNPFQNVLQANRPPYRNEKRRTGNNFKSSCSIPSFSTPCQALLLVGVKPENKPSSEYNNNSKPKKISGYNRFGYKPPVAPVLKTTGNVIELPALDVNGAGDLVIRKKQIISG